ncbi:MAG TPA: XRE family transcriptional regulator [Pseudolabrys sp.]|nr:XRE family transcriptional regulator [Pseudolabrys sp.]
MITGSQCAAARMLVEINRRRLAEIARLDEDALELFENGTGVFPPETVETIARTLEDLGALFIPEEGALGAGVRLKFNRSVTRKIDMLENEGGPARSDDVP